MASRSEWQTVGKEVAIIVAGVLIALFAQQIVDGREWAAKVETAENAMLHEILFDNGPQMAQRVAMDPCIRARLDEIRGAIEGDGDRARIASLIDSYWVDIRTWDMIALNAVNASDIVSHMPEERFNRFASSYMRIPTLDRTNAQEGVDVGRLRAFRRVGGPVSDDERDRLLAAVEALRADNATMVRSSQIILPRIATFGTLDDGRIDRFLKDAREHYGACIKDPHTRVTGPPA